MQTQTRRVALQKFLRGIQICHRKADVLAIPKVWWFLLLNFLNQSYGCLKSEIYQLRSHTSEKKNAFACQEYP